MNTEEKILAILENHGEILQRMDRRMDRLEDQMSQMQDQIGHLDERSQRTSVLLETEVDRKLGLLYEGHGVIVDTLDCFASKSRVEVLENDVTLLKDAVRLTRQEITELKKAQ